MVIQRSNFIIRVLCLIALLLLGSCATQPAGREQQAEVIAEQAHEIKRLQARITELDKELDELILRESFLEQQVRDDRLILEIQTKSIADLKDQLKHAEEVASSSGIAPAESVTVRALKQELAASKRVMHSSQREVKKLESQLQSIQTGHEQQVANLEQKIAASQSELDAMYDSGWLDLNNLPPTGAGPESSDEPAGEEYYAKSGSESAAQPAVIKVFYGTNRAHLEVTSWHYVSPFLLPALLLVLLFAIPRAVHAIIRTYLHRVTINLFRVALVLGVVYFGISATHETVQRWQDAHELPLQYGTERLTVSGDGLKYKLGTVDVSIPPNHVKGRVEQENFIYFEFRSDPAKHFVLSDIKELDDSSFFDLLSKRVSVSDADDLFVFVHGFHNTFEDAAFRTAQIAHDSGFKGAPVFYSWPSQGSVLGYTTDENNVDDAKQHLTGFLEQIKERSGAQRIHLIAHSMGSRALTAAVHAIALKNNERVFDEMVLAAPDLDAGRFKGIAPELARATSRLTLYASSKDSALSASRKVHGGKYQRAGESFPTPVTVVPVDTIDVSNVTSGHSYIADNGHILEDLNNILVYGRKLDSRIAQQLCVFESKVKCENPENLYWQLVNPD